MHNLEFVAATTNIATLTMTEFNLTGCTVRFKAISDTISGEIKKSTEPSPGGITLTDPDNGLATITFDPADLPFAKTGSWNWEVRVITAGGDVYSVDSGNLTIAPGIEW